MFHQLQGQGWPCALLPSICSCFCQVALAWAHQQRALTPPAVTAACQDCTGKRKAEQAKGSRWGWTVLCPGERRYAQMVLQSPCNSIT